MAQFTSSSSGVLKIESTVACVRAQSRFASTEVSVFASPGRQLATMNAATVAKLNVVAGEFARFRQADGASDGEAMLTVEIDERVPEGCVRLPAGLPVTAGLGAMTGLVTAERIA